jgi:hypothetical protein
MILQVRWLTEVTTSFQEHHSFTLEDIRQSFRSSKFWRKRNSQRNIGAVEPDINSNQVPVDKKYRHLEKHARKLMAC